MTKAWKDYLYGLAKLGYLVQLDKDDNILCAYYWHPELLVSKIFLK